MRENFKTMPTKELLREFSFSLSEITRHIKRAAKIYCELRSRGYDVSRFQHEWIRFFPAIASGKLNPAVLTQFGGYLHLVEAVGRLPMDEQKKLLAPTATVPILRLAPGQTKYEVVSRRPLELSSQEIVAAFGQKGLREPTAQTPFLPPLKSATLPAPPPRSPALSYSIQEFDLLRALPPKQREELLARARNCGVTAAEYTVHMLAKHKYITPLPVTSVTRSRKIA